MSGLQAARRNQCTKPGCWQLKELGDAFCLKHSHLVRYEIKAVVVCAPRTQEVARRREPRELASQVIDGLKLHGFEIAGSLSVRQITPVGEVSG